MDGALEMPVKIVVSMVPFLLALTCHEFAHGLVAKWFGDNTAERSGRLTLNPISHMDPIGTLLMPIMGILTGIPMIGWAKPVPVDERNLKNPRSDMFWIALAGPLSNILMATIAIFILVPLGVTQFLGNYSHAAQVVLSGFILINLYLAVFNILPVHPLDGGKIIERFLSYRWRRIMEEQQGTINMVLLVLFFIGGLAFLRYPVAWLYSGIGFAAESFFKLFLS